MKRIVLVLITVFLNVLHNQLVPASTPGKLPALPKRATLTSGTSMPVPVQAPAPAYADEITINKQGYEEAIRSIERMRTAHTREIDHAIEKMRAKQKKFESDMNLIIENLRQATVISY